MLKGSRSLSSSYAQPRARTRVFQIPASSEQRIRVLGAPQSTATQVEVSEQGGGHGQANEDTLEEALILLAQHQLAFLEPHHRPFGISSHKRDRTQESAPEAAAVISVFESARVAGRGLSFSLVEATGRPERASAKHVRSIVAGAPPG